MARDTLAPHVLSSMVLHNYFNRKLSERILDLEQHIALSRITHMFMGKVYEQFQIDRFDHSDAMYVSDCTALLELALDDAAWEYREKGVRDKKYDFRKGTPSRDATRVMFLVNVLPKLTNGYFAEAAQQAYSELPLLATR